MLKYKERSVTGLAHTRWHQAVIQNPVAGALSIIFNEQEVFETDSKTLSLGTSTLKVEFDPSGQVPLLDLTTGEPTGEFVSQPMAAQVLFSLYADAAAKRDAASA